MGRTFLNKRDKISFQQLCDREGIETRTTGNHTHAGWIQIDCPFCGPNSKKFHLGYNISRGSLNCWKCGKKRILDLFRLLFNKLDSELHGIINAIPRTKAVEAFNDVTGTYTTPKGVVPLMKKHKEYLRSRRFNPGRIEKVWNVGSIGMNNPRLKWRLFIPIESDGYRCSWTTRSISTQENTLRYVSASPQDERISHKKLLYGEDLAGSTIIIVEGPMDAWRIGPGAVCTFGTRPTPSQMLRMGRYAKRYVCFDQGAERYSQALVQALSGFPGETYNITLDADDPDTMSRKELSQIRRLLQ